MNLPGEFTVKTKPNPDKDCFLRPQLRFPITNREPGETIAFQDGRAISVKQFLEQVNSLSSRLPNHRYVFNLFTDRYQYLLGFCASIIAGQCTLMPPNRLEKTLEQLALEYSDSYFLGDTVQSCQEVDLSSHRYQSTQTDCHEIPLVAADQLCAIAFTSGSTGSPAPNLKYWRTLRTGSLGNAELLLNKPGEQLNIVATVPPQHMWGLETSILLPLFAKTAISDRTPFYPQDIADALASLPEPRALVSSPMHLSVLLKSEIPLVSLDLIFSATAPMSKELAEQLESHFKTRVIEAFGCSESGILAGRRTTEESLWHLSDLFDLEVKKNGVLIKAPHLPGDVLLQDVIEKFGHDRFKWLGRHHDMVNIAGKRGSLTDLNRCLLAIKGVTDGVVFQPGNGTGRLVALVVAPGLKPSDILEELKLVVDSVFLPRPIHLVSTLPRQETGKLAHTAIMSLYKEVIAAKKSDQKEP